MASKFAPLNPRSPISLLSNSNRSGKNTTPPAISFASQIAKCRTLSVGIPAGKGRGRTAAGISALYAPSGSKQSLYELLGVSENGSTLSDIKKAYKKMARKYHPDVSPPDRVDEHTRKFIMVKEAYETLSNPQSRALYDRDLAHGSGFGYSPGKTQQYSQRMEDRGDWRMRWQSQLDGLKKRSTIRAASGRRMRNKFIYLLATL